MITEEKLKNFIEVSKELRRNSYRVSDELNPENLTWNEEFQEALNLLYNTCKHNSRFVTASSQTQSGENLYSHDYVPNHPDERYFRSEGLIHEHCEDLPCIDEDGRIYDCGALCTEEYPTEDD